MGITKFGIWGPKSRSVNSFSQRSDFGPLGILLDKFSLSVPGAWIILDKFLFSVITRFWIWGPNREV